MEPFKSAVYFIPGVGFSWTGRDGINIHERALLAWSPAPAPVAPPAEDEPQCAGPFVSAFDCPKCDPRRHQPAPPVVTHHTAYVGNTPVERALTAAHAARDAAKAEAREHEIAKYRAEERANEAIDLLNEVFRENDRLRERVAELERELARCEETPR